MAEEKDLKGQPLTDEESDTAVGGIGPGKLKTCKKCGKPLTVWDKGIICNDCLNPKGKK